MKEVPLLPAPLAAVLLLSAVALACGNAPAGFGPVADDDASDDSGGGDDAGSDACGMLCGDGRPPCHHLECQVQSCAPLGKPETTLTGTIFDPAGLHPVYDVFVYIPNATPDPITPGEAKCAQCQAPASGSPIAAALTDHGGRFTLTHGTTWGVPGGDDIPLVVQVGKWRRQLKIPHVDDCTTQDLDQTIGKDAMRLPSSGNEGDMPFIAITTGCDQAECWLRRVGIDDSEFGGPAPQYDGKHVHMYTAWNGGMGGANSGTFYGSPPPPPAVGNTPHDTYAWWQSEANLLHYDLVLNSCECGERNRNDYPETHAYAAMKAYLDGGGRLFATHYYYNWFALSSMNSSTPPSPDFQHVAQWDLGDNTLYATFQNGPFFSDSSFPKGKAYTDWLLANVAGTTKVQNGSTYVAQVPLTDLRLDVERSGPPAYPSSTRWLFAGHDPADPGYATTYLSFNSPVGAESDKQCGRAVFTDVHLAGSGGGVTFPQECIVDAAHQVNEDALEFLFFDLSSCVQKDSDPPVPPPQ